MKKRIIGITAAFLAMVCCFVIGGMQMRPIEGAIVDFSYADIKDDLKKGGGGGMIDGQKFTYLPYVESLVKSAQKGVILVVKTGDSKNILRSKFSSEYNELGEKNPAPMELQANQTYSLKDVSLSGASHVETEVEVLKVLFQTERTNLKAGQQATIYENYYIMDKRITDWEEYFDPSASLDTDKGIAMLYEGYFRHYPLEKDQVYIIFGGFTSDSVPEEQMADMEFMFGENTIGMTNVYCLSEPGKAAGAIYEPDIIAENLEYIRLHYDIEEYLK